MTLSIPSKSTVVVTVTADLVHRCPFKDETDEGTVTIQWRCEGGTLELHQLAAYLKGWQGSETSHEDITDRIAYDLIQDGVEVLGVTTTWHTAGMEVRCVTSPTPRPLKFDAPW